MEKNLAFIGAGNMGSSLIGGLISNGYPPQKIWVSNVNKEKLSELQSRFKVNVTENNVTAAENAQVVILCVKPDKIKEVTLELADVIKQNRALVVSIASGISTKIFEKWIGGKVAVVRCMPNTPALINAGATGLYANSNTDAEQRNAAESILRAVGVVVWVDDEKLIDAITVISGCGPAYFFYLIEILQNIAIKLGISKESAQLLTQQTAFGASCMVMETQTDPTKLREMVTSKGGTTESIFNVLKKTDLEKIFYDALKEGQKHCELLVTKFED